MSIGDEKRGIPDGRERICRAAERLFAERGYAAVSMRDIAEQAGLSKAAVYHHFSCKEELFVHVMERGLRRVARQLRTAAEAESGVRARLKRVARVLIGMKMGRRGMMHSAIRDVMSGRLGEAKVREVMRMMMDEFLGSVASVLDEGIAAGEIRRVDTKLAAGIFLGMVRDIGMFRAMTENRPPSQEDADLAVELLLNGIAERKI